MANPHAWEFAPEAGMLCSRKWARPHPSPLPQEAHRPRWDESLIGEDTGVLESVSLSLGERVGVRASVLRNGIVPPKHLLASNSPEALGSAEVCSGAVS